MSKRSILSAQVARIGTRCAAGLVTAGVLALGACAPHGPSGAPTPLASPQAPVGSESWLNQPIPVLAQAITNGEVTSEALVRAYIRRIERIDRSGPTLQSVLAIDPEALPRARELDIALAGGASVGPLHGVPILLKDNIEARGALPTTAGSTALIANVTDRDSPLVDGLRRAGAVILGKTNLSQWANFRSSASLSGWSAVGGQVRNPHILDRNPCGSSSGSGAAVAAALAAGAVGTETNGSIICPSNVNGVVGFKPTVGLVSAQYIVPISFTQDTAGPMTRTVAGAAMMMDAMAGKAGQNSFAEQLDKASLAGARLGVLNYSVGDHPGIRARLAEARAILQAAGAVLVDLDEAAPRPANARALSRRILNVEFKHGINAYLKDSPADIPVRSLAELIAFNREAADSEMVLFGQDIFEQANATKGLTDPAYQTAVQTMVERAGPHGIDRLLDAHNLDALVFPSGPLASPIDAVNGDVWPSWVGDGATAAVAGYPHLTVPMGAVHAVPIGLSFVASKDHDAKVLSLGYAFEQASRLRIEPRFLTTAEQSPAVRAALSPAVRKN